MSSELPPLELLSIKESCRILGVGRTTLYALIKLGKLRVVKIGRRSLLLRTDIKAFVAVLASEPQL